MVSLWIHDHLNALANIFTAQKCDVLGYFLPDDAPLPPHSLKAPDDWSPYHNWLEFELADFLFTHAEMPIKKIDVLLEIWAASMLKLDLYHITDSTYVGNMKWKNFTVHYSGDEDYDVAPWMSDMYDVWYCDPHQVVHNILASPQFTNKMDYIPYWEYDTTNDRRQWQDFMSGNWAWDEADWIIQDNLTTASATLVPIILGSNKTMVSVATGQMDYYPLYLSIGNVQNTVHCGHHNAKKEHANFAEFCKFKQQLFHSSLTHILYLLCSTMKVPEVVLFGDDYYWHVIYSLAAYIVDYEEQVLLLCILFMNNFPCADIHQMLSPDILHQLIKGGFKDHLVEWVEKYLIHIHGKTEAEKILDEIDWQYDCMAPFTGLWCFPQGWHFKQWTGDDSKGLMKVYIAAIEGYMPKDVQSLDEIDDALQCFHHFCEVFWNTGVVNTFLLPQQHSMKHYNYLIHQFGAPNRLCSSITKLKHIKAVKWPYWHTNCFQALGQMLLINQRLDKLATAHAVFKEHGMLNGSCVSQVLQALDQSMTGYKEDAGEMVDTSMRIDAHKVASLADELNIPQFPNILYCYLHSQLHAADPHNPDNIPLDKCPFYNGKIHVFNLACSTFFTPSDLSGIYDMHHKYIHSCPMWQDGNPHLDCIFVVTDPQIQGMHGLDIACILCFFFSFKYLETDHQCAIVHWFDHLGDGPDKATGMWIVHSDYQAHNICNVAVIHIDTIYHAAHLIPVYTTHNIDSQAIEHHNYYDMFHSFYVNKYADHHVCKIAF
ncbi:hypothetical protein J3A83DRAFT_4355731 [Scleroderma citrinum]